MQLNLAPILTPAVIASVQTPVAPATAQWEPSVAASPAVAPAAATITLVFRTRLSQEKYIVEC